MIKDTSTSELSKQRVSSYLRSFGRCLLLLPLLYAFKFPKISTIVGLSRFSVSSRLTTLSWLLLVSTFTHPFRWISCPGYSLSTTVRWHGYLRFLIRVFILVFYIRLHPGVCCWFIAYVFDSPKLQHDSMYWRGSGVWYPLQGIRMGRIPQGTRWKHLACLIHVPTKTSVSPACVIDD